MGFKPVAIFFEKLFGGCYDDIPVVDRAVVTLN
jgi:hypothetical protein